MGFQMPQFQMPQRQFNPYNPFDNPWRVANKNAGNIPPGFKSRGIAGTDQDINVGFKNNPQGSNPTGPYAHGNGGLFSVPGQMPQIFSAMQLPMMGLIDDLPIMFEGLGQEFDGGDRDFGGFTSPLHTYITGVTQGNLDNVANQPTTQCTVGPEAGLLKACTVTMPYGKYRAMMKLDLEQIAQLRDRSDPVYLQLMNMAPPQTNLIPSALGQQGGNQILINEFAKRAFSLAVSWKRLLASQTYAGNPTNSSTSVNYQQIEGFDLQINAGNHKDAFTNMVCTALDSDLKDFGSRVIGQNSANNSSLYQNLDMLYRYCWWNASREGLLPVSWKWVMHPNAFDEICKIWPVEQFTEALLAIGAFTNGRVTIDGKETIDLRNAMRAGSYLPIRGIPIEVVQDDTVTETNVTNNALLSAGQYASGIYLMPYTVLGGMPITYIQPFNWANGIMDDTVQQGRLLHTFTTDGGLFRWYVFYNGSCVQWDIVIRFRVRTHMPQIAGRLQNVGYAPLQHVQSWDPNSAYFKDGGRTNIPQSSFYVDWSSSNTPTVIA